MTFDQAFEAVIGHEGGYVNNPKDPGGETKYGISKRAYPTVNIAALTLDDARAIYRRDYWAKAGCDQLPEAVRFDVFDAAVNSGVSQAVKWLQQACLVSIDGVLGSKTLLAASTTDAHLLRARITGYRLQFMTDLASWPLFGRGWAKRLASNLIRTTS